MAIQTLDYRDFQYGGQEQHRTFCHNLCETLSTWGFIKIQNTSIPDAVIDELFSYNKKFFALPEHIKQKARHPAAPNPHRGWSAVGQEQLSRIAGFEKDEETDGFVPEYRESFDQGAADDELFPNRWIDEDDLPGFRKFMENYYEMCYNFHTQLLRAISTGLSLPEDLLLSRHQTDTSELRMNHYPAIACENLKFGMRIGEHSDFGTLTLLLQDSTGGLQVEDQKKLGTFIPVESDSRYEVIVNVGDCLQRWTNRRLRSANHRVHLPEGKNFKSDEVLADRYSVAYFGKPDRNVLVDSFPEFCRGGESKYNDHMNALEYNQTKLLRTYA
ncbi:Clavaminate synthase-like protein [Glarea lozoyensis ATCC 20868]|uniref:2-oxoglutarate-dependent dioxygenase gloF n=1 Tax=Glarea lozoyensis (strain ATCC 20868 / MF5171) TaxID=1116229 RepID=GLOF_GLAL2|nr:Clavaminate synthase-like protein [Glarea lozoyensis ATCC 20868]S3D784.1 RecName: Full=2-oxoglutarate-dependent dioxygenase gloF; AltName: Full=Pneumocandin biosynthesis cluster protein F; AltName: Full=Proline hydroxylase [Glarea lozoyensis ATCC 20868]EPE34347.1 Clavaminate synthase-like protein [Glarea lozoyensis ATCC 20868]